MPERAEPPSVARRLAARVDRHGPIPFSEVVDLALYEPAVGFYEAGGHAGRRGDFLTSPEVGPLFGAALARALDAWWDELGAPDPYVVVEGGAGAGTLARAVLAAEPRCAPALRYVLVERSALLRRRQGDHLALAPPGTALGAPDGHDGPVVTSLGELPAADLAHVVVANELLDNLAFDLVGWDGHRWFERRVDIADGRAVWHDVEAPEVLAALVRRLVSGPHPAGLVPVQRRARDWVVEARSIAPRVVIIDYVRSRTAEVMDLPLGDWLRTYRGHERAPDPLDGLGGADITVDVCLDQLTDAAGVPSEVRTQAEALRAWGIDDLVAAGRAEWAERAGVGDLAALRARSRVREAEALVDPAGLGAFTVVEWVRS